ncbi:MAG: YlbF family regulator [Candidatus Pacearchaeota archaeon]
MNEEIKNKTKEFAQAILGSEEYKLFKSVSDELEKNEDANNLLKEFQKKQMELRSKGFDPSLMDELRELQTRINKSEIIQQFANAQNELVDLLKRTNNIISLRINMPFVSTVRGGC